MWELDCEEGWAPKNWCFWAVVFEKTLESPLDCEEIQPVHSKGDWSWVFLLFFFNFTILYWFSHTSTCIRHRCTRVLHLEPPSHLPLHTIPLGHPSAPAPSFLYPALNLDWRFVSYMILCMFQCHSPKSSPLPLPQRPKVCSIHLCLFCCLAYGVIVTIFLNSIYMP